MRSDWFAVGDDYVIADDIFDMEVSEADHQPEDNGYSGSDAYLSVLADLTLRSSTRGAGHRESSGLAGVKGHPYDSYAERTSV